MTAVTDFGPAPDAVRCGPGPGVVLYGMHREPFRRRRPKAQAVRRTRHHRRVMTLTDLLPAPRPTSTPFTASAATQAPDPDAVFTAFAGWAKDRGLDQTLLAAAEDEFLEFLDGKEPVG